MQTRWLMKTEKLMSSNCSRHLWYTTNQDNKAYVTLNTVVFQESEGDNASDHGLWKVVASFPAPKIGAILNFSFALQPTERHRARSPVRRRIFSLKFWWSVCDGNPIKLKGSLDSFPPTGTMPVGELYARCHYCHPLLSENGSTQKRTMFEYEIRSTQELQTFNNSLFL